MRSVSEIAPDAPELRSALEAAELPTDDLTDAGRRFFRFDASGEAVAYGGYELHGDHALLRSVVVLPEQRGRGFGTMATEEVLRRASAAGARDAYLLTTTAEAFFQRAGFVSIDRSEVPQAILETRQAASICSTAALLVRKLHD